MFIVDVSDVDFLVDRTGATISRSPTIVPWQDFNACTGASLELWYNEQPEGNEDTMQQFLLDDVGTTAGTGQNVYDAYITQAPWIPAIQENLQDMSPWIAESPRLLSLWNTMNPTSKQSISYNGAVRAVPMDTDYIALGYRSDLLARYGKIPPNTLEEMVELSEFLNGKDHNGDGEPDWGFCLTPQPNYFYAFVAPILQRDGCKSTAGSAATAGCDNIFFDTDTFEPLLNNAGFKHAVALHDRFLKASNCHTGVPSSTVGRCNRKTAFPTGRCAGVISMPGTMNSLLGGGKYRVDEATNPINTTGLEGGHWGRRIRFPGSSKVLDKATNTLVDCTTTSCPKATPLVGSSQLVNFVPFFSEGGEAYSIRGATSERKKEVVVDFLSWLSTLPLNDVPLSGQYSRAQLTDTAKAEFIATSAMNWPGSTAAGGNIMVDDLFNVLGFYFAPDTNTAQDLFIIGFSEYMGVIDTELYDGFLLNADDQGTFDDRYDRFLNRTIAGFDAVTERYGRLQQLKRWRASVGLPAKTDAALCAAGAVADPICTVNAQDAGVNNGDDGGDDDDIVLIVGLVCGAVVLIVMVVVAHFLKARLAKTGPFNFEADADGFASEITQLLPNGLQERQVPVELQRSSVVITGELGKGAFGEVNKALYHPNKNIADTLASHRGPFEYTVATKSLKAASSEHSRKEFMREAAITAQFSHSNVIGLIGVVTRGEPALLVLQFCEKGALDALLKSGDHPQERLTGFVVGIANGMAYLASRGFVHRDLASRNVLVDAMWTCKVADFGLSRDIGGSDYYKPNDAEQRLPLRWCAPEVFTEQRFGEASDVFAYGVTVVEVFTEGATPYRGWTTAYVCERVAQGYQQPRPETCPQRVYYEVLSKCLSLEASKRPTFAEVCAKLQLITPTADDSTSATDADEQNGEKSPGKSWPRRSNSSRSKNGSGKSLKSPSLKKASFKEKASFKKDKGKGNFKGQSAVGMVITDKVPMLDMADLMGTRTHGGTEFTKLELYIWDQFLNSADRLEFQTMVVQRSRTAAVINMSAVELGGVPFTELEVELLSRDDLLSNDGKEELMMLAEARSGRVPATEVDLVSKSLHPDTAYYRQADVRPEKADVLAYFCPSDKDEPLPAYFDLPKHASGPSVAPDEGNYYGTMQHASGPGVAPDEGNYHGTMQYASGSSVAPDEGNYYGTMPTTVPEVAQRTQTKPEYTEASMRRQSDHVYTELSTPGDIQMSQESSEYEIPVAHNPEYGQAPNVPHRSSLLTVASDSGTLHLEPPAQVEVQGGSRRPSDTSSPYVPVEASPFYSMPLSRRTSPETPAKGPETPAARNTDPRGSTREQKRQSTVV